MALGCALEVRRAEAAKETAAEVIPMRALMKECKLLGPGARSGKHLTAARH